MGLFTHVGAAAIDGKPPATTGGPRGPLNCNIRDVFLHGEGSLWEFMWGVGVRDGWKMKVSVENEKLFYF